MQTGIHARVITLAGVALGHFQHAIHALVSVSGFARPARGYAYAGGMVSFSTALAAITARPARNSARLVMMF